MTKYWRIKKEKGKDILEIWDSETAVDPEIDAPGEVFEGEPGHFKYKVRKKNGEEEVIQAPDQVVEEGKRIPTKDNRKKELTCPECGNVFELQENI